MHNITYRDFSRLAQDNLDADIGIRNAMISQMSERLVRHIDLRILDIIEKRLGCKIEPEKLAGRLTRIITRGAGYETLLLDGLPFARVYEAELTQGGLMMTVGQVIEELSS